MPVNSEHASYQRMLPKWKRCRDVAAGQDAVHAGSTTYLPKLKAQENDDYNSYVARAGFYNATWRTISGLVGMLFRKPPKIEVPEEIRPLLEDVNGQGQPFQLLLQMVSEEALKCGRLAVLVDYPEAPPNISMADAIALNLRPTMHVYSTFSVINWRMGQVNNQTVLTMAVLKETEWVPTDEYTGRDEDRWRVLDLVDMPLPGTAAVGKRYRQRVYKLKGDQKAAQATNVVQFEQVGTDVYPTMPNGMPLDYIPLVIMGTDDVSDDVDEPPLIDLVDLNLSHYRTMADYEHGCHFTALPTLFLAGFKKDNPNDKVYVGSETAIVSTSPDAHGEYIEFSGAGLGALERNLERKEKQMAILGARMLEPQQRQVEAADTAAIHRKGEESTLSSIAQALSLGMTKALKWFCSWAGVMDTEGVLVELNRNFFPKPMTPAMLSALLAGWQQGAPGLSDQGLFEQLQEGEIVREDVTLEEEQARIAERQREQLAQQIESQAIMNEVMGTPPAGGEAE